MTSRHLLVWGEEGQNLIRNSRIAIIGLDNIGLEVLKSAAMLGISSSENVASEGHIYLADDRERGDGFFLDIQLKRKEPRAESLEEIFKSNTFQKAFKQPQVSSFGGNNPGIREDLIRNILPLDAIIDTTNSPSSQYQVYKIGKELNIDTYFACCNRRDFQFKQFFAEGKMDREDIEISAMQERITQYENQDQGIILSTIASGIILEAFKKRKFIKNKSAFAGKPYEKILEQDDPLKNEIKYSLDTRLDNEKEAGNIEIEGDFHEKSFLICGCGAIGNPMAEMLARLGAKRIDLIDYDIIEDHNLERQPLFYGHWDKKEYKAKVLCEKIKKINPKIETNYMIGYVCDDKEKTKEGKECINLEWFATNRTKYDLIFGCMDGGLARFILNKHCTELGLTYIDGGSSPRQGHAVAFVPGRTVCLECAMEISKDAKTVRDSCDGRVQEAGESEVTRRPIDGNVNMSNRAAAGLMLCEARKIINPKLGPVWNGIEMYTNNGAGFLLIEKKFICPHYKNGIK